MTEERSAGYWMVAPLRKYAVFSGRARRAEYWWFYLLYILLSAAAAVADIAMKGAAIGGFVTIAFTLPLLAVGSRRLHDVDRTGWWLYSPVLAVVPFGLALAVGGGSFVGHPAAIALLVLAAVAAFALEVMVFIWSCTTGTDGPNRFGDDPLRPGDVSRVFD